MSMPRTVRARYEVPTGSPTAGCTLKRGFDSDGVQSGTGLEYAWPAGEAHPRVHGVKGMLGVDERRRAALPLDLRDRVHCERRLAAAFRPEHLSQAGNLGHLTVRQWYCRLLQRHLFMWVDAL